MAKAGKCRRFITECVQLSFVRYCRPSPAGNWYICSEQIQHRVRKISSYTAILWRRFTAFWEESLHKHLCGCSRSRCGSLYCMERCTRAGAPSFPSAKGAGCTRPNDYLRRDQFVRWFVHQYTQKPDFSAMVFFTDDACFTRERIFISHNSHIWAGANPHAVSAHCHHQQRFVASVWAGIVNDFFIGPYLLPRRLSSHINHVFLKEKLPDMLKEIPLLGSSTTGSRTSHRHHDDRRSGRGGAMAWPPRSQDLTPMDFFLRIGATLKPWFTHRQLILKRILLPILLRQHPGIVECTSVFAASLSAVYRGRWP